MPPDLVILDIGLPDSNGFEICASIRGSTEIPILILTARSDEVDRIVGLELGADDYVVKPFSPREVTARVRAILRRAGSPPARDDSVEVPDIPFSIDRDRYIIHYFDEPLTLSRYEFRILEVLIGHPGRVYSRAMLMDQAWEDPGSSTERTVDAHIKSIRARLRAVRDDCEAIVTHRGLGYSLRETW
jgi:two-component system catabolic regulation response regulator CreB